MRKFVLNTYTHVTRCNSSRLQQECHTLPCFKLDLPIFHFSSSQRADQELCVRRVHFLTDVEIDLIAAVVEDDEELCPLVLLGIGEDLLIVEIDALKVSVDLGKSRRQSPEGSAIFTSTLTRTRFSFLALKTSL